jgi:opacity protein-like surface antigen
VTSPRSLTLALAGLLVSAGAASAQDNSDWYVSLSGGVSLLNDSDNAGAFDGAFTTGEGTTIPAGTVLPDGTSVGWTTDFDRGYALAGAIGRRYGAFRGEVEVAYQNNNVGSHTNVLVGGGAIGTEDAGVLVTGSGNLGVSVADLVADGQGGVETIFVMANAFVDIDTGTALTPYLGAGVGVGFVDVNFSPSAVTIIDDTSTEFAWQAMAGAAYQVSPSTEFYVGYRYRSTSDAGVAASLFSANLDVENTTSIIEGGIRFSF